MPGEQGSFAKEVARIDGLHQSLAPSIRLKAKAQAKALHEWVKSEDWVEASMPTPVNQGLPDEKEEMIRLIQKLRADGSDEKRYLDVVGMRGARAKARIRPEMGDRPWAQAKADAIEMSPRDMSARNVGEEEGIEVAARRMLSGDASMAETMGRIGGNGLNAAGGQVTMLSDKLAAVKDALTWLNAEAKVRKKHVDVRVKAVTGTVGSDDQTAWSNALGIRVKRGNFDVRRRRGPRIQKGVCFHLTIRDARISGFVSGVALARDRYRELAGMRLTDTLQLDTTFGNILWRQVVSEAQVSKERTQQRASRSDQSTVDSGGMQRIES
jgi:hypothetical protein